jgi:hypothetical protein
VNTRPGDAVTHPVGGGRTDREGEAPLERQDEHAQDLARKKQHCYYQSSWRRIGKTSLEQK